MTRSHHVDRRRALVIEYLGFNKLETKVVRAILELIEERNQGRTSLEQLSVVEADLLATVTAKGVIGNGGLHYWYQGKGHDDTQLVARGFSRLGLPAAADAMMRSLDAFPDRRMTPAAYRAFCEEHHEEAQALWEPLDQVLWNANWDRAALAYVVANAPALLEVLPEAARELTRLERGWARAADCLRAALDDAADLDRAACRLLIAANDHHFAHAQLVDAGPRADRVVPFWTAMREAAEVIGAVDDDVSLWSHRFATRGYVAAEVEVVLANDSGVYHLKSGPVRWNRGARPRRIFGHRAELYARTTDPGSPAGNHIYDRGVIRLVPARAIAPGETIVVHRGGTVIARGTAVEMVAAASASIG